MASESSRSYRSPLPSATPDCRDATDPVVTAEGRLALLGIELPPLRAPVGNFTPLVRHGRLCFLSGQGPVSADGTRHSGCVGQGVDIAAAREHARLTTLNLLSVLRGEIGSLDRVSRVVRLFGMVNAAALFADHQLVMEGATSLLFDLFGARIGQAAGIAVGLGSLPSAITVEIELIVAVDIEEE